MTNLFHPQKILKAAIITGCFFMCACENDVNEVRDLGKKKLNLEEGRNIESYLSMNGKMRAHLTAPLLLRSDGDSGKISEFPNTLHVDFYNDSTKKIESQLNADYGRYRENDNKIYLRDHVVFFNNKGDTIYCEDMYWDQSTEKFYTYKKATVVRNFGLTRITPLKGMTASQDFSHISFFLLKDDSFFFVPDSAKASGPVAPPVTDTPVKPKIPALMSARPVPK
jgi:hypothetical protein